MFGGALVDEKEHGHSDGESVCDLPQDDAVGAVGDSMLLGGFEAQAVSEPSALEQLGDLVNIVGQLETIWLDDPNIQQEIDSADWQEFMDVLYDNLLEVYLSTQ